MNRIIVSLACIFVPTSLLFFGGRLLGQARSPATVVCGPINSDAAWTTANSPYDVCTGGVTVAAGASLTIQPGVTVMFQANSRLVVNGALAATGSPTQAITFTGATASPGSWAGIFVDSAVVTPAQASLSYVTVEYAGVNNSSGAQVSADHGALTLAHSLIRNGGRNGVYATGHTQLDIHDTHFANNSGDAVRLIQPDSDMKLANLTATGNGQDAIYVGSTTYLHGQRHWPYPGLPYIIDALLGNFSGDSLTIDPGNELRFTSFG